MDLSAMRKPYNPNDATFDISDLASRDPFEQFKAWFEEVRTDQKVMEANAMALATCSKDGFPSVRMVLLKGLDERGFIFYTDYNSRKGRELTENPRASLMFYWDVVKRQIRIEGDVERLPVEESDRYFSSRPIDSQLSAASSKQSKELQDRQELLSRYEAVKKDYEGKGNLQRPSNWGGFLLRPKVFEFWQGQTNRLHDRLRFLRTEDGAWKIDRLSP